MSSVYLYDHSQGRYCIPYSFFHTVQQIRRSNARPPGDERSSTYSSACYDTPSEAPSHASPASGRAKILLWCTYLAYPAPWPSTPFFLAMAVWCNSTGLFEYSVARMNRSKPLQGVESLFMAMTILYRTM